MNDVDLSGRIAAEIRSQLGRQNINKSELARRLNVSHTWVTNRLVGTQEIGTNELVRIAEALGVGVADLLPQSVRSGSMAQKVNAPKTLRYGAVRTIHTSGVPAPRTTISPPTGHMATKAATRSDDHRHRRTGRL
jgi:transcriptional regulator with XRE-family HTH domain